VTEESQCRQHVVGEGQCPRQEEQCRHVTSSQLQAICSPEASIFCASQEVESYAAVPSPTEAKTEWSLPRSEYWVAAADGTRLYFTERGAGDIAFVVVAGFSGGHRHGSYSRLLGWFSDRFLVLGMDQRGHWKSEGSCTLSHLEVMDVDAAIGLAKSLGAQHVVTLGFSMGSSSVLRHAALSNPATPRTMADRDLVVQHRPDAVISVGGAAEWWYRGTRNTWMLHRMVGNALGRIFIRRQFKLKLDISTWPAESDPNRAELQPIDPLESVRNFGGVPLLVVQGSEDDYFPPDHGQRIFDAAASVPGNRASLWLEDGMGHAENATTQDLARRMGDWVLAELGRQS